MPTRIIIFEDNDRLRESLAVLLQHSDDYLVVGHYNNCDQATAITQAKEEWKV
jgi:DNA-binding NarL/FixJ family response regulator